jgi:archaetidylinositol phosphate synthase
MADEEFPSKVTPVAVQGIPPSQTQKSIPFRDALRVQEGFTARAERKTLAWLAARLPLWVNSDHLTLLGFAAMFLAGVSYALARISRAGLVLATLFLALNWFGDSLDGTLARIRNQQ